MTAPLCMSATDYFITPEGAGEKTGSNWENAMGLTELYSHMKFVFNTTPVNDSHTGEQFYFSTGTYTFTQTIFFYRSNCTLKGGYDPTTGELATSGRTVFDGANTARNNGALFIMSNTERNTDAAKSRAVNISGIDFENFVTKGEWRANETNWQSGRPGAVYIAACGYAEINDCNFRNNKCTGSGDNAMAGALSLNKVNALVRNCSFTGNEGTDGGAIKQYYNMSGEWTKMSYLTIENCFISGNKSTNNGGAVYARNSKQLNIINSTLTGNEATDGGAIHSNGPGDYTQIVNIVSSTIAGNTAPNGSQIYTGGTGALSVANSIIVADGGVDAIADASATSGYKFQGNNFIGNVAEGYTKTESDMIGADNTYAAIFGDNALAANGTITPVKFVAGMAPDAIASIVAEESWNFSVDSAVDQLGNARSAQTSNGALAVKDTTTGIDAIAGDAAAEGDNAWYTLQGIRLAERPAAKGIYIHNGHKYIIR